MILRPMDPPKTSPNIAEELGPQTNFQKNSKVTLDISRIAPGRFGSAQPPACELIKKNPGKNTFFLEAHVFFSEVGGCG